MTNSARLMYHILSCLVSDCNISFDNLEREKMTNNMYVAGLLFLLLSAPLQVSGGPVAFAACVTAAAGPACASAAATGKSQIFKKHTWLQYGK